MALHYVDPGKINDKMILDFINSGNGLEVYFDDADDAFEALAVRLNVTSTDDYDVDADGYLTSHECIEWYRAYVGMQVCFDAIGKNNNDISPDDKYTIKYEMYRKRLSEYEGRITEAVITGNDTTRTSKISTVYAIRG